MRKQDAREVVHAEWRAHTNEYLDDHGKPMIYESQKLKAIEIVNHFIENDVTIVTLVLPPQWGKTGTALCVMYHMTTHPDDAKMILPKNVFMITGMSDTDWVAQTRERLLPIFQKNVFHRNKLASHIGKLKKIRDSLIVVDECHIGTSKEQTLHSQFKKAGLLDIAFLRSNNIKILMISATPDTIKVEADQWGDHHRTVIPIGDELEPAGYVGFGTLIAEKRVLKASLSCEVDVAAIIKTIQDRWPTTPRYHIFRISVKMRDRSNLRDLIEANGYLCEEHDCTNRIKEIDAQLDEAPVRHHFIFIKGFWTASKTLNDKHIGVCYEAGNDNTRAAQGLGGRLLGWGKQRGPAAPLFYCSNPELIQVYQVLLRNDCNYMQIDWNTIKLKRKGPVTKIVPSVINPAGIANLVPEPVREPGGGAGQSHQPPREALKKLGTLSVAAAMEACDTGEGTWLTKQPLRLSQDEYTTKFRLKTIPKTATAGHPKIANVSYTKSSAQKVANLTNYFKKPEWAGKRLHIIKEKYDAGDVFIVIERDLELLENLKKGDVYFAHNEKGTIDKYVALL
jgi:hypothetical protein